MQARASGSILRIQDFGFRVKGVGFRRACVGFRVQGSG